MMKKILLTLAYLLLLGLMIAQGVFFYLKLADISKKMSDLQEKLPTPLPLNNTVNGTNIPTLQPNGTTDSNGQVNNVGTLNPSPTNDLTKHNTYISVSGDGTGFAATESPIFKSASVPEVVKVSNEDLLLYFVDASTLTTPGTERLGHSRSTDNGKTWSEKQLITITGKANAGAAVDPSVVELADGTFRMYFFGSETTQGDPASVEGDHVVYSAVSTDGINWTVEEGERFAAPKLTDPEVIQLEDSYWVMYYALGTTTGIATSSDGLEWFDSKQSWSGGGIPGAYVDNSGVVHIYGCSPEGLMTATSADGTTFSGEPTLAFNSMVKGICDPSPVLLDEGSVMLVYKQIDQ